MVNDPHRKGTAVLHRATKTNRWRHPLALLLIATLCFSACGVGTADTTSRGVSSVQESTTLDDTGSSSTQTTQSTIDDGAGSGESSEATTTDVQPTEPAPAEVEQAIPAQSAIDVWAMDMHPNGSQAVVNQIEFTDVATIVTGTAINGRDFRSHLIFDGEETTLRGSNGQTYALLEGVRVELEHGESASYQLSFEPVDLARTTSVTVALNVNADDSRDLEESFPGFTLADIDVTAPSVAPTLPAGLPISASASHPSSATLRVAGISFTQTNIGVGFVATNSVGNSRSVSGGHHASFLEDDLGNRYRLKFGGDERFIRISAGDQVTGVLVFSGRIHPAATSLTLVMNEEQSATDDRELNPKFVLGPWPLDGSFVPVSTERAPITIEETQNHPNTTQVTLHSLSFSDSSTTAKVSAINPRRVAIRLNGCCDTSYLLDNLGNRYALLGPADNERILVEGEAGIEGEFSFAGRVSEDATSVEMILGDRGENDLVDPDTSWPEYRFGPYQLRTQAGAATVVTPPSGFGSVSTFAAGALETSTSTEAALIFSEFSGVEIDGGVLLTLPEGILFDSGESRLRPGATTSINKIIQILEFYAGDDVIVVGHTDSEGGDDFNLGLSTDRANEVRDALVRAGAASQLITIDGRGESEPVASNDSEAGRAENRRVEIMILTTKGLPE